VIVQENKMVIHCQIQPGANDQPCFTEQGIGRTSMTLCESMRFSVGVVVFITSGFVFMLKLPTPVAERPTPSSLKDATAIPIT
jgi:hypothetical protein